MAVSTTHRVQSLYVTIGKFGRVRSPRSQVFISQLQQKKNNRNCLFAGRGQGVRCSYLREKNSLDVALEFWQCIGAAVVLVQNRRILGIPSPGMTGRCKHFLMGNPDSLSVINLPDVLKGSGGPHVLKRSGGSSRFFCSCAAHRRP